MLHIGSDAMNVSLYSFAIVLIIFCALLCGCVEVPHDKKWGIYALDLQTQRISLIYSTSSQLTTLRLNTDGDTFVFSQFFGGDTYEYAEICTISLNGNNLQRLTNNSLWDLYPTWSPNGSQIAFLSLRDKDLDIYLMNRDGTEASMLYDSGSHDADIHWIDDMIVFTSNSSIWKINDDGSKPIKITNPPRAGEWGNANLPFGDYDPQLNQDASKIVFERLVDDTSVHGNYNIFMINIDGTSEIQLTNNSYSQGFPTWSHDGESIAFLVAAINDQGTYDLYRMDANGMNIECIVPDYIPDAFLCHVPIFSHDDSKIYFIGEWWD